MTTAELKYNLFKIIDDIDDVEILSEIKNLLELNKQKKKNDFWDELTSENKEEINKAIKESMVADKLTTNADVFNEYTK